MCLIVKIIPGIFKARIRSALMFTVCSCQSAFKLLQARSVFYIIGQVTIPMPAAEW